MAYIANRFKLKGKHKIPVITVTTKAMTGNVGTTIETAVSVNHAGSVLDLADGTYFQFTSSGTIRLIDSSIAGTYTDMVTAVDPDGFQAIPVAISAVVSAGTGLPAITLTDLTAPDYQTIQAAFATDAAYARYVIALDLDYGNPKNLSASKQVIVAIPGKTYDCAVAGVTSGGTVGPWSNVLSVAVPDNVVVIQPGTTARMSDAFNRFMGQNTLQVQQNASSPFGSAYWTAAQTGAASGVRGLMAGLGCQTWRVGMSTNAQLKTELQYLSGLGHKFCILANLINATTGPDTTQIPAFISQIKSVFGSTNLSNYLVAIEGLNEVNNPAVAWATGLSHATIAQKSHDFQAALYSAIRADAAFANVPCLSFSDWARSDNFIAAQLAYNANGQRDISDGKPWHGYPSGHKPSVLAYPSDTSETGNNGEQPLTDSLLAAQTTCAGKSVWTTETGFIHWQTVHTTNCTVQETGATPSPFFVTDLCKAKYISRQWLEQWIAGVPYCFNFMFLNNWNQRPFYGLYNQNKYVGGSGVAASPNANTGPPYTYTDTTARVTQTRIHTLFSDVGADFTPGNLDYHFTGAAVNNNLHHCLLQKRNGDFYILAAWDYKESYSRSAPIGEVADSGTDAAGLPLSALRCNCTLQFNGGATVSSVTRYEPVYSASGVAEGTGIASKTVNVKDSLMIWKVTP